MKSRQPWKKRWLGKPLIPLALLLVALVGLSGCFRSHWHSRHDPERMEKKMNWIQEDLAEFLELKPDQEPAYNALVEEYKNLVRRTRTGWKSAHNELADLVAQENPDPGQVGEALKRFVREKPTNEELEALIDRTMAFYRTLDAEQQERLRERIAKRVHRHS